MIQDLSSNGAGFRRSLKSQFESFLNSEAARWPDTDCIRVDLHCHDRNSDVPDELWGRILGLPETWLETDALVQCTRDNGCDVVTVTNHNNARSCWDLKAHGEDVLVGAEFTCFFPEYELYIHVLGFGFDRVQEEVLLEKRRDIYEFLKFAHQQNIPVIQPHPLYFYSTKQKARSSLFEKLAVMFQRFEVLNGQRDLWQSVLTLRWVESLSEEKILRYAKKHNLNPADFGVDPARPKILSGGSDDHMGIFAGSCGTRLYVPDLARRSETIPKSELALEAIREGRMSPFGLVVENQKLNIALLDYFAQVSTKIHDPGLLRMMMHQGDAADKLACLAIANLLLELQSHRNTQKFFNLIHDALNGKAPSKLVRWQIRSDYHFCIDELERIAAGSKLPREEFVQTVNSAIERIFKELNLLIIRRVQKSSLHKSADWSFDTEALVRKFEVPSQLSALFFGGGKALDSISGANFKQALSLLSFPILVATILLGTMLASTRALYANRQFLKEFAGELGSNQHPERVLYLTDTLRDKNGVSSSLSGKLQYFLAHDMPVDFLICHADVEPEPHLHVIKPLVRFDLPNYSDQEIRIPDVLEIVRIFYEGGYDRVVCSTEGPMAAAALLLKQMFNVPASFFMHTDWMEFIRQTTDLSRHEQDRVRRLLRLFYHQFDQIFVLNSDHHAWLTSHEMSLGAEQVVQVAHYATPREPEIQPVPRSTLFADATPQTPILLFAGRLSKEKGIVDVASIYNLVRQTHADARLVVAGVGPDEELFRSLVPDAHFTGWIDKDMLFSLYASVDCMLFPSRFDTFGNVVLEAFSYGLPVAAYACKGPKDIVQHDVNGFLADDAETLAGFVCDYLQQHGRHAVFKNAAVLRASEYSADRVMADFCEALGIADSLPVLQPERSVA